MPATPLSLPHPTPSLSSTQSLARSAPSATFWPASFSVFLMSDIVGSRLEGEKSASHAERDTLCKLRADKRSDPFLLEQVACRAAWVARRSCPSAFARRP